MSEKVLGYILLGGGLFVMIVALVYVLLVFSGNRKPVQVFSIPAPTLDINSMITAGLPEGQSLRLPKNEIEVVPTEDFNRILNMSLTFFLMGFVVTFGFKIASLGVMLVRPIKVNVKEASSPQAPRSPQ
jgi:hypothetical protein